MARTKWRQKQQQQQASGKKSQSKSAIKTTAKTAKKKVPPTKRKKGRPVVFEVSLSDSDRRFHKIKRGNLKESRDAKTSKKPKKQKKKQKKQVEVKLTFPKRAVPISHVPWTERMRGGSNESNYHRISGRNDSQSSTSESCNSSGRRSFISNIGVFSSISASMWDQLDQEIEGFAEYVQLRRCERDARNFVVGTVSGYCATLFQDRVVGQDVSVQPFGSFATPQLCSFSSDVDLSLWGVVPVPTHVRFERQQQQQPRGRKHDEARAATTETTTSLSPTSKRRKRKVSVDEGKVKRWRQALEHFENEQNEAEDAVVRERSVSTVSDHSGSSQHRKEENVDAPAINQSDAKDLRNDQLFVIDREGALELGADEQELAESGLTTTATNNAKSYGAVDPRAFEVIAGDVEEAQTVTTASDAVTSSVDVKKVNEEIKERSDEASDDDGADKLENLGEPTKQREARPVPFHSVSLSSSTSNSEEEDSVEDLDDFDDNGDDDEQRMEVGFVATAASRSGTMDDGTRRIVVASLNSLARKLRKSAVSGTIEVRRRARVPIISFKTTLGFECDAAIGGHSGTDTSAFAATQAARFKSFGPVVLVLKILLSQYDLDKPFTGGLGSWKIYVLLTHHLEIHVRAGGRDSPAEVLLSFFYRFSGLGRKSGLHTALSQDQDVACTNGTAEMKAVFQIQSCRELFREGFLRLRNNIRPSISWLSSLVKHGLLKAERTKSIENAGRLREISFLERNGRRTTRMYQGRPGSR